MGEMANYTTDPKNITATGCEDQMTYKVKVIKAVRELFTWRGSWEGGGSGKAMLMGAGGKMVMTHLTANLALPLQSCTIT